MKQSRTVVRSHQDDSPFVQRHLPLVDLLIDARTELFELAVRSGLKVLDAMLEEDRTMLCGPRYAHQAERVATRMGTVASGVVRAQVLFDLRVLARTVRERVSSP